MDVSTSMLWPIWQCAAALSVNDDKHLCLLPLELQWPRVLRWDSLPDRSKPARTTEEMQRLSFWPSADTGVELHLSSSRARTLCNESHQESLICTLVQDKPRTPSCRLSQYTWSLYHEKKCVTYQCYLLWRLLTEPIPCACVFKDLTLYSQWTVAGNLWSCDERKRVATPRRPVLFFQVSIFPKEP